MLLNPIAPFTFLKLSSLKVTVFILLILLIKTNMLRIKGGLIGGLFALILLSGILLSSTLAIGSIAYAINIKRKNSLFKSTETNIEPETINI
ncbi:MAG: hypothetical protein CMK49_03375 [Prochlorococcus sp. SP3034]|nr:hypothetical protein [Prochlorococcus sp. SP3034]|tara:strand:- start:379 stop:654 length:276 start_codon:yes stop_codon:yes gene_type:complete